MKWQTTCRTRMTPIALTGLLLAGQSAAETPAQQRDRELDQRLERSEAKAAALQQRLEELERRLQALGTAAPASAQAVAPARPASAQAASPAARTGPGSFEIDEEAAQRALERTLTQSGALLLPARTIEVTPSFTYRRVEQTNPVLATITNPATSTPDQVVVNQRSRRSEYTGQLELRAGLPYNAQLEIGLPFNRVNRTQITELGTTTSDSASGVGDFTLGMAKTLMRESGWKPDLIGRLSYNFGNGKRQTSGVDLGSGFRQVHAEFVVLKRQDPLAFVASTFYNKTFEKDSIKPGDVAGVTLATLLAASPATSLQLAFSQIHRKQQELNGARLAGTDQTYGIATLGASSVLSRDMTLVTQFGIGLGNDAPKYSFTVALPILFR